MTHFKKMSAVFWMFRFYAALLAVCAMPVWVQRVSAQNQDVIIRIASHTINSGDWTHVPVQILLPQGVTVGSLSVVMNYNAELFEIIGCTSDFAIVQCHDDGQGEARFSIVAPVGLMESRPLVTFQIKAKASTGNSVLRLTIESLTDDESVGIPSQTVDGLVCIGACPNQVASNFIVWLKTNAFWLSWVVLGLLGWFWMRVRKKIAFIRRK
jgi:hypothetical protein